MSATAVIEFRWDAVVSEGHHPGEFSLEALVL
jgi:hypothetical protein